MEERKKLYSFLCNQVNQAVARMGHDAGYANGYVALPPTHPFHNVYYTETDEHVDVHGGLTFCQSIDVIKQDKDWVQCTECIGFDSLNDIPAGYLGSGLRHDTLRRLEAQQGVVHQGDATAEETIRGPDGRAAEHGCGGGRRRTMTMPCDCMSRIEKKMTELMIERNPGGEIVEEAKFQNKALIINGKESTIILTNPILGKFRKGKAIRKFDTQVMPTYCPFCGKKLKSEEAEMKGGEA